MLETQGDNKKISRSVMYTNRLVQPKKIVHVLKSEIKAVINNYLDVKDDYMYMDIIVNKDGLYELRLRAITNKIKMAKSFE